MHLWAGDCPGRRSGCWSLWGQGRAGTPGLGTTPGEGQTCGALGVQERDEAETWTGPGADTTAGLKLGAGAGRDRLYLLPAPLAVASQAAEEGPGIRLAFIWHWAPPRLGGARGRNPHLCLLVPLLQGQEQPAGGQTVPTCQASKKALFSCSPLTDFAESGNRHVAKTRSGRNHSLPAAQLRGGPARRYGRGREEHTHTPSHPCPALQPHPQASPSPCCTAEEVCCLLP